MEQERIREMMRTATHDVFATMLGIGVEDDPTQPPPDEAFRPCDGVVSLVGLSGTATGTGALACSPEAACQIAGGFLMQEFDDVNVDVLDAMGEVANMVLGGVKSNLEEELGPMGLSSPTVIYGRNYITHSTAKANWMVLPFLMGDRRITVRLCLTIGGEGRPTPVLAGALTVPV